MYIITTSRMTSGDELNLKNGLGGLALDLRGIKRRWQLPRWSDRAGSAVRTLRGIDRG